MFGVATGYLNIQFKSCSLICLGFFWKLLRNLGKVMQNNEMRNNTEKEYWRKRLAWNLPIFCCNFHLQIDKIFEKTDSTIAKYN